MTMDVSTQQEYLIVERMAKVMDRYSWPGCDFDDRLRIEQELYGMTDVLCVLLGSEAVTEMYRTAKTVANRRALT